MVADQFATCELRFFIAIHTLNIMQKAEMMFAFSCCSSWVSDFVIWSSTYAGSCVDMSLPGTLRNNMLSSLTWDRATNRMLKNANHVVGLSAAP